MAANAHPQEDTGPTWMLVQVKSSYVESVAAIRFSCGLWKICDKSLLKDQWDQSGVDGEPSDRDRS